MRVAFGSFVYALHKIAGFNVERGIEMGYRFG